MSVDRIYGFEKFLEHDREKIDVGKYHRLLLKARKILGIEVPFIRQTNAILYGIFSVLTKVFPDVKDVDLVVLMLSSLTVLIKEHRYFKKKVMIALQNKKLDELYKPVTEAILRIKGYASLLSKYANKKISNIEDMLMETEFSAAVLDSIQDLISLGTLDPAAFTKDSVYRSSAPTVERKALEKIRFKSKEPTNGLRYREAEEPYAKAQAFLPKFSDFSTR